VSGVEEEEIHQATASAGIVSRVEEEGSREGRTSDDIIASHISGAGEAAREVPVYSVEQAHGDGPTFDEADLLADPEDSVCGVEEPAGEGFSLFPFSPCLLRSYVQHVRFAGETMRNFA